MLENGTPPWERMKALLEERADEQGTSTWEGRYKACLVLKHWVPVGIRKRGTLRELEEAITACMEQALIDRIAPENRRNTP